MIDPRKLSDWFKAYAAGLSLYARQFGDASANDVVQDAFVNLLQQPREPVNVKAWLYCAVRNGAISRKRSERRREARQIKVIEFQASWFEPAAAAERLDADAAQRSVESLPQEQRDLVVLRIWGSLSFEQMAEITGSSLSTVHDRYRAALKSVRRTLERP